MNILITGGSKGIGAAIVKKLAAESANKVYFTFANSETTAKELAATGGNIYALHCDFTNPASVDELVSKIPGLDIDILINNAYPAFYQQYFHKMEDADIMNSFSVNILPVIKITKAAIPGFRKKKGGRIINILSTFILNKPPTGLSDYTANKNYLLSLSKSWATENAKHRITSNSISPSFMETDFTSATDSRIIEQIKEAHPLKTLVTPEEVADAVLFFCHCSPHINGVNLPINAAEDLL
jgi:3-oxoacyl-[acyl-carrier protein] reductase